MHLTKSSSIPALLLFSGSLQALNLPQNSDDLFAVSTPYNLSSSELRIISTLNNSTATPEPAPLLNLTVPDVPPASNDIEFRCSFGHELTYDPCLDALNQFVYPPGRNLTIGQRRLGFASWDLELPIRWLSGNGLCSFDLVKRAQARSSLATGDEIASAATALLNQCVHGGNGQGGIALNIGPNRDVGLILRPFTPRNVGCCDGAQHPYRDHCNELVQHLPAATGPLITFGPEGRPGTQEILPKVWASRPPNGCVMAVSASSRATDVVDTSTFYDIWQAFVTLKAMCVRYDKMGKVSGLGTAGKMSMDVMPFDM